VVGEEPSGSPSISNECGGAWLVPPTAEGGRAVPGPGLRNLHTQMILSYIFSVSPKLSLILACLTYVRKINQFIVLCLAELQRPF
jgi:hypothetical protein